MIFNKQDKLLPLESYSDIDFGFSTSVYGDICVVGCPSYESVYIYKRHESKWSLVQRLVSIEDYPEYFGYSVGIDKNTIVVGAVFGNIFGKEKTGIVYIYEYNKEINEWELDQTLLPSIAHSFVGEENFGWSISIHNNRLVVGAPGISNKSGGVFIFEKTEDTWKEKKILIPDDLSKDDLFGLSIAVYENLCLVGCPHNNDFTGSVYSFLYEGETWIQNKKLTTPNTHYFGISLDLHRSNCVIGSYDNDGIGAAYIYKYMNNTWIGVDKLVPEGDSPYFFGDAVAIYGKVIIVSEQLPVDNHSGVVHIYEYSNDKWNKIQSIQSWDGPSGGIFGSSIDIDDITAVVGYVGEQEGSVYVFLDPVPPYLISSPVSPNPGYYRDSYMIWKIGQD